MKFKIKDKVKIKPLEGTVGLIRRIQIEESGTLYDVRYFSNGEAHGVWFYEEELELKNE
jgi:hypothetical protein